MAFDIDALLNFEPAKGRCRRCLALSSDTAGWQLGRSRLDCSVCGLVSVQTPMMPYGRELTIEPTAPDVYPWYGTALSLDSGPLLKVTYGEDLVEHAKRLATIGRLLREGDRARSPLRLLVDCFVNAKAFIHLTTYGVSQALLGVLATVSEWVPIAGIVSGADKNTARELESLRDNFPNLGLRIALRSDGGDQIHTKLIIVDGLLALTGSANLTTGAWRKAAQNKEHIEVTSEIEKVISLNNRLFSPHWASVHSDFEPTQANGFGWTYAIPEGGELDNRVP